MHHFMQNYIACMYDWTVKHAPKGSALDGAATWDMFDADNKARILAKMNAVLAIEPIGDTPFRKAVRTSEILIAAIQADAGN